MVRQILALSAGVLASILGAAAGGYLIYRHLGQDIHTAPIVARYVMAPTIAVLVGVCVGLLARAHPGILAALSLVPENAIPLFSHALDSTHFLLMLTLAVTNLLIGGIVAALTFWARNRMASVANK
jgi:hypothetical protein